MSFHGEPTEAQGALATPVAIAAVTVDGRCRERSPADMALFGPARDRLIERFTDQAAGQDLLVRATADGAAEGMAELETAAGAMPFRISLWRQRGGDRIRLIAAFAQVAPEAAPETKAMPATRPELERLETPLQALIALAEQVRASAPDGIDRETTDLVSSAWRLKSVLDALEDGAPRREVPLSEIDLARLTRRVMRMAGAGLAGRQISAEFSEDNVPGLNVLGDEHALWDMLDHMVAGLVDGMGEGGRLVFSFAERARGCAVSLTAERALIRADLHPRIEAARRIAAAHLAEFALTPGTAGDVVAEVRFPPGRCLSAL